MGAALEAIGRCGKLSHAEAFFRHGDAAGMLTGHHSAAFTLDVYAHALPHQMDEAGEKVAAVIIAASGSILVANSPTLH